MDGEQIETALANMERFFGPQHAQRLRRSVVRTPLIEISSTDIRQRAAQGKSIAYLVPAAVNKYISEHDLYRA